MNYNLSLEDNQQLIVSSETFDNNSNDGYTTLTYAIRNYSSNDVKLLISDVSYINLYPHLVDKFLFSLKYILILRKNSIEDYKNEYIDKHMESSYKNDVKLLYKNKLDQLKIIQDLVEATEKRMLLYIFNVKVSVMDILEKYISRDVIIYIVFYYLFNSIHI
jgi:hypothetical protein